MEPWMILLMAGAVALIVILYIMFCQNRNI